MNMMADVDTVTVKEPSSDDFSVGPIDLGIGISCEGMIDERGGVGRRVVVVVDVRGITGFRAVGCIEQELKLVVEQT